MDLNSLPHNLEAEKAVLGCVLVRPSLFDDVSEVLRASDFYDSANAKIYSILSEMISEGMVPDMVNLCSKLLEDGLQDKISIEYITGLAGFIAVPENAIDHAKIVKNNSLRRKMFNFGMEAINIAKTYSDEVDVAYGKIQQKALDLDRGESAGTLKSLQEIYPEWFEKIKSVYKTGQEFTGIDTRYTDLNELTGGLQNTDLIILAGRPSMGKTSFAVNLTSNISLDVPALFFSLEMSKDQIMNRMIGANCGIDLQKILKGGLTDEDLIIIEKAKEDVFENREFFIDDQAGLDVLKICSTARRMKKKHGIGLIIIDYLQLVTYSGRTDNREQEISRISGILKGLAKELNIPVVALSQLNRKVEERTNKRPKCSDLRESGSLEQDADLIWFIYRDEVYNKAEDNPNKGLAEIIIAKQRNGPIGTATLSFIDQIGRFENLTFGQEF